MCIFARLLEPKKMKYQKHTTFLTITVLLTTVLLLLPSCKSDPKDLLEQNDTDMEDYYEFQGFDLSNYDIPATIMLPDETANIGASTQPEVLHTEDNFYWDINVGPNFQMHIEDFGDNIDLVESHKKSLKEKAIFEVNYIVDEKYLVLYERRLIVKGEANAPKTVGIEHKSYHVYGQKIIDGITYELRSRDEGYERMIIELMAKSIRSFEPVSKDKTDVAEK